ncbi:transcription factor IIF subunit tfg1 [Recurvomyces mirabilis]|nr:transcription factor IIF subunit tfg1 [Recurvomyces mirabilis]
MASRPAAPPPNATPQSMVRKKAPVSIFNPKKKPQVKRPAQAYVGSGQVPVNGARPHASAQVTNGAHTAAPVAKEDDPSTYSEYPITVSKSALMRGLHYHGFRMQSKLDDKGNLIQIDPFNEREFTRPVRLYRRRPQDKPEAAEQSDAASGVDDKEREAREIKRAERQKEREANQALIAPSAETASKKTQKKKPQKKVEDVYWDENNPKNQARSQLRYEEARPWHMEDFDYKNKFSATYEEPLSRKHVMLEVSSIGTFNMVPVEKWYRMARVDRVKAFDDATIIKMMDDKKHPAPRWLQGKDPKEVEAIARQMAMSAKMEQLAQHRSVKKLDAGDDDGPSFIKNEEYRADVDEIDFEFNDEFQDDDEGFIWGDANDDEAKDTEKRVRDEMRTAGLPDADVKRADEDDWVNEEKNKENANEDERKRQKKMRKQLKRKESRFEYDSDDGGNRYRDSSESEDSEEEREREAEEQKKREAEQSGQTNGDKSGDSTKGTDTPTGRLEKKSMKREADASDASGNESSRKKAKLNGAAGAVSNGARQLLPDAAKRFPSGYGSGSETDTSRAGRTGTKLRLKNSAPGSPRTGGTPNGSRAASPTGSRAQSPARPVQPTLPFPTVDEIQAAIPPEGIALGELVQAFRARVAKRTADFIAMVKEVGRAAPGVKGKIVPKTEEEMAAARAAAAAGGSGSTPAASASATAGN